MNPQLALSRFHPRSLPGEEWGIEGNRSEGWGYGTAMTVLVNN
ncbi:MAG: hypothetical protein WCO14_03980 [bacterium]